MPRSNSFSSVLYPLVLGLTIWLAPVGAALADSHAGGADGGSPEIKYRQSVMDAVGANMGGISDILKNGLVMPGHVANHARQMALAADLVSAAFKNGSASGPTDAQPEIWTDWPGFEKAIGEFKAAAKALDEAASGGDAKAVGPAVKALGKSCGGCHKAYRKPKEESYKNQ